MCKLSKLLPCTKRKWWPFGTNEQFMRMSGSKVGIKLALLLLLSLFAPTCVHATQGALSDNQRISSDFLGYDLQYRVYTPPSVEGLSNLPVLYVADGQWYIKSGRMHKVVDREIRSGRVKPLIVVFVDSNDPDRPRFNRRNSQFFCNQDYARFFVGELVPEVDGRYPTSRDREDRVILGLSFGGLNAACFGLLVPEVFGGIAMHSPAIWPVPILTDLYESEPTQPVRVFMTVGTIRDGAGDARALKKVLEEKGYDLNYREVNGSHNWANWRPLQDDVLRHFFPKN